MYYYSKNSRRKVIHTSECFHLQNVEIGRVGSFETLREAYQKGYRLCRCCSPIVRQYRKESEAMTTFCRKHAVSFFLHDHFIGIYTPCSKWRIIPENGSKGWALYHKNTYESKRDGESAVPGYHRQKVSRTSVKDYLEYIVEHENYRMRHPVYIGPAKQEKLPPRKGTKRYRKQQAQEKRRERRRAIANVLQIIEGLHTQPQTTAMTS